MPASSALSPALRRQRTGAGPVRAPFQKPLVPEGCHRSGTCATDIVCANDRIVMKISCGGGLLQADLAVG